MIPTPAAGGAKAKAFVYLIQSQQDGTFYIGWTSRLLRRLVEHNEGSSYFSRRKLPWNLIGFEAFSTVEQAKARERALKRSTRMSNFFKKRMLNQTAKGRQRQVWG
ncbi:MAG: GIY-YIG nuclease family protein [Candidatus Omnitrophica bacterium]|nr:GIY-YIG nuclease family protein [Candidatus Omnitrophota bacterium]